MNSKRMFFSSIRFICICITVFVLNKCQGPSDSDPENNPPAISSLTANPDSIEIGDSSTVTCVATDPDGDNLTYSWQSSSGSIIGDGSSVIWVAPQIIGVYSITCEVSDGNGGADTGSTNIEVTDTVIIPDTLIILDNFDDNNAQNLIGEIFGQYKIDNMGDPNAVIYWGGGFWYAEASNNGGMVISSDNDTIIDSSGATEDNPNIIANLMSDGALYVILSCQGCVGDYWASVGCDLAGDHENPYLYDTLENPNDYSTYWDFTTLDSVRIKMRGMGAALFFLESKAVKDKFSSPDFAWGFHGFTLDFGDIMANNTSYYSFSAKNFKATSPEGLTVSWADASKKISAFGIELDVENDDRLEIEIDKIEFFGLDTVAVFPFMQ